MKPKNIESIFTEYLGINNTQYALLINGGWGTGKTFFWKKTLIKLSEQKNFKPIYISLNGIKTIEALQRQLFIRLIPFFEKRQNSVLKTISKFGGNLLTTASKAVINVNPADLFQGIGVDSFNFSNKVVCFDDLERCQIPIKELLGFINGFVEHKNLKCLILADEDKIFETNQDQKTGYHTIKEKVIGRTLNYEPELSTIIPLLCNSHRENQLFHTFLNSHQDYIYGIFNEHKESNIRIIAFFIDSLRHIYRHITDVSKEFKKEILFLTAITSIEFKRGHLKSKDYNDYMGLGNASFFWYQNLESDRLAVKVIGKEEKPEKEKTYAERFYLKYVSSRLEEYTFYESIYSYILSGYLDIERLSNELEKRKPEQQTQENIAFEQLLNYDFRKLEDDKFTTLSEEVLDYAENGAYTIYSYERLSHFYHYFSEKSLISYTPEQLNEKLLIGIEVASQKKEIDRPFYSNMVHFAVSDPVMQPFRDKIIALHEALDLDALKEESTHFIELLGNENIEEFIKFLDEKKYDKDLIANVNGKQLFKTLKDCSNQTLMSFNMSIRERYKHTSLKEFFPKDYGSLNEVRNSISDYLDTEKLPSLRKFLWLELLDILKIVCEVFEKVE